MPTLTASHRDALAELVVLELFDRRRSLAGHDYGAGQRHAELIRRRHRLGLQHPALELVDHEQPTADEVLAAFERIARPRLRRLEREGYRSHTPATRRTLDTWHRVARELEVTSSQPRRDVVVVGWDGTSKPMLRYADELHLSDSRRSIVRAEDRP